MTNHNKYLGKLKIISSPSVSTYFRIIKGNQLVKQRDGQYEPHTALIKGFVYKSFFFSF